MIATWYHSDRTRFILRRGVLRFGVAIGLAAAWLAATAPEQDGAAGAGRAIRLLVPPVLAFLEWGIGCGWLVGALLWWLATRGSSHARAGRTPEHRRR